MTDISECFFTTNTTFKLAHRVLTLSYSALSYRIEMIQGSARRNPQLSDQHGKRNFFPVQRGYASNLVSI
jgi:hypothetical protein